MNAWLNAWLLATFIRLPSNWREAIAPSTWSNWAGVIIGLTLVVINRQTKAAETSAKAALLNAQAVIESERPWIVVTIEPNEVGRPGYFRFRVTNTGRTPAQVVSAGFAHEFKTNANELPIPPRYEPFLAPNNTFLPPGDHFNIHRTLAESTTGIRPESIIESRSLENGPIPAADILFFYGNIVYDDILGKTRPGYIPHETRWCFAFFKDGRRFVRTGPHATDEYNRYT